MNFTRLPPYVADAISARLNERESAFSPYASRACTSRGRSTPEPPSQTRSEYQRDRDRILHTNAFRRLKHKTQVFVAPLGDHYATRLTHTLEVAQIGRTIARALNLNEDLTEAISLGHDLGHTPFGHIGEDELDRLCAGGFRHSRQSLRIVDQIEKEGAGLNLTWEVRQGILQHSKPRGDFLSADLVSDLTLEGQICRVSDAVAYLNHDLIDAFRAGVLTEDMLPTEVEEVLGRTHSQRIDTMVSDIVASSWASSGEAEDSSSRGCSEPPRIVMSDEIRSALVILREFMFAEVYIPEDERARGIAARDIVQLLYRYFDSNRHLIPAEYARRSMSEDMAVVDFVSGMTDRYALRAAEKIQPGITDDFDERIFQ